MVEKKVHPVLRGEQHDRVDLGGAQIRGEPAEPGTQVVALFGRRWLSLMRGQAQTAPSAPLGAYEGTSAPAAGPDEI